METHQSLKDIFSHLERHNLSAAIAGLEAFLSVHPHQVNSDRLHALRTDYQLMADYWKRGFKDPQLPALYQTLLQRMYVLCANISKHYGLTHSSFLSSVYMRLHMTVRDWSPQNIREEMESFVSDVVMLELEPEHKREVRRRELYRQHQHQMNVLFDYIYTSDIWSDGMASTMEEILLSPTIDTNDQQLIVSAVMLSLLEYFDMAKFRTLVHVYQQASDEQVRQRALIGWVFGLNIRMAAAIYPELYALIDHLLEDPHCCEELVELQKQIVFCINTEQDTRTIQQEIMPDIIKNQGFRITRNGIEENEEDPMEDILNPGSEERKIEKMEESFQKMAEMQKQGTDIYFGGFSQMKRFPFFNELSNWFVPFYSHHPAVAEVYAQMGKNRFMEVMTNSGPFCNSDKYSFVFAFQQVLDRIPENMRGILERNEMALSEVAAENQSDPAYIRRMCLQDLYRFYRIFNRRNEFVDPFSGSEAPCLFFANPLFSKTRLEPSFNEIVAFLLKKNRQRDAVLLLKNYGENRRDFQFWMMAGYLVQKSGSPELWDAGYDDLMCYEQALAMEPDNEKALMGYGRALFSREKYREALAVYDKLVTISPEKKSYLLNRAVCLTNVGQYGAALKDLYRLNYEAPDNNQISRVLAWTLVCEGKYEAAEKIYRQLLTGQTELDDLLKCGYCLWFNGQIADAADCFHRYIKECDVNPTFILSEEAELLKEKGITEPEQQMMLYIL
jgi:tetratricopeptide (TPR) repeat protein